MPKNVDYIRFQKKKKRKENPGNNPLDVGPAENKSLGPTAFDVSIGIQKTI